MTDVKLQMTDVKLQMVNVILQMPSAKLQMIDVKLQMANAALQMTDVKLQMVNVILQMPTAEMTWGETGYTQVYMKEETSKQSRCFALTSIELLGAALFYDLLDADKPITENV